MPQLGGLTTHVLDTANGCPAASLRVCLYGVSADGTRGPRLAEILTNPQGRSAEPLLAGPQFKAGRYCLDFAVADYFRARGVGLPDPPFLDVVTVAFGISDPAAHYHVPLLVSPYGYSTYRGS